MSDDVPELYRKHRPRTFRRLRGQPDAVAKLEAMVASNRIPHAVLFHSTVPGTGKTTAARILARRLTGVEYDIKEVNAADQNGIDTVREIRRVMNAKGLGGNRVWILDEVQRATPEFQTGLLKPLEDPPDHVYFFLCTTHLHKILPAVRSRCTQIEMRPVAEEDIQTVLEDIVRREEEVEVSKEAVAKIAQVCGGSAREAVVLLQQVMRLPLDQQFAAISPPEADAEGIAIARALLDPMTRWSDLAKLLKACKEEPEGIRHLVLSYMTTVLLGGRQAERALLVISHFRDHWHDCKRAGLVAACYEVCSRK